jgi:hypothetical protein
LLCLLQGVIGVLLNGSMDLSAMPRVPLRPTHSRHGSFHELPDVTCSSSGGGVAAAGLAAVGAAAYQSSSQPGSPMSAAYSPLAQVGKLVCRHWVLHGTLACGIWAAAAHEHP